MQDQINILHEIKELYNSHSLSVMVGAGFSLNAMKDYPLWDNMLYDLAYELYKNEIEDKWNLQFHTLISANNTHDSLVKENVYDYIHKIGYLNIVSEYIHRKGYREAIDYYIEEHMPLILDDGNNGLIKKFKGEEEPFDKSNLQTHRQLLMCDNWRNVYTTNYDNLLDITAKAFNMDYKVCDKDYKLSSLGNNKGIIKIHGSLAYDSLSAPFEFDNDKSIRYIISKEDYDTYAAKHQAFSYLMRT
ncbi:MAG: SIR2 family protein [Prevotella sp.]|nr:SIR2 family protein [Prevotella sp.]MCH4213305.1 SIR2 family protein [Prevotella sp.]